MYHIEPHSQRNLGQFVEAMATGCLVYTSGQVTATLMSYETRQLGAYIGISSMVLLALFIYATAAASGGHMNPMITFSSILMGICPLSRGRSAATRRGMA